MQVPHQAEHYLSQANILGRLESPEHFARDLIFSCIACVRHQHILLTRSSFRSREGNRNFRLAHRINGKTVCQQSAEAAPMVTGPKKK
jgi:hypothetical protein